MSAPNDTSGGPSMLAPGVHQGGLDVAAAYQAGLADGRRQQDERWVALIGGAIALGRGEITPEEFRARHRGPTPVASAGPDLRSFLFARLMEHPETATSGYNSAVVSKASADELSRMAVAFSDHPDYREAWRP